MRILLSGLIALSVLAGPVRAAECIRPGDHSALDVTALKTKLMVTALTCGADEKYNAFVMKYRPELNNQDKALGGYFSRSGGRRARQQQDDYVTQLANSQSQTGLRQGSLFCAQNLGTFDEVMALRSGQELPDYAAGKSVLQPIALTECGTAAPASTQKQTRKRS